MSELARAIIRIKTNRQLICQDKTPNSLRRGVRICAFKHGVHVLREDKHIPVPGGIVKASGNLDTVVAATGFEVEERVIYPVVS